LLPPFRDLRKFESKIFRVRPGFLIFRFYWVSAGFLDYFKLSGEQAYSFLFPPPRILPETELAPASWHYLSSWFLDESEAESRARFWD
jgi:hypothetical protein